MPNTDNYDLPLASSDRGGDSNDVVDLIAKYNEAIEKIDIGLTEGGGGGGSTPHIIHVNIVADFDVEEAFDLDVTGPTPAPVGWKTLVINQLDEYRNGIWTVSEEEAEQEFFRVQHKTELPTEPTIIVSPLRVNYEDLEEPLDEGYMYANMLDQDDWSDSVEWKRIGAQPSTGGEPKDEPVMEITADATLIPRERTELVVALGGGVDIEVTVEQPGSDEPPYGMTVYFSNNGVTPQSATFIDAGTEAELFDSGAIAPDTAAIWKFVVSGVGGTLTLTATALLQGITTA